MQAAKVDTPVGIVWIEQSGETLVRVGWGGEPTACQTPLLDEACRQMKAYFDRRLRVFDLPLAPSGSDFHQSVFREMSAIPYGETVTYGEIAAKLDTFGQPVGQACGANPIPIIIPCHRVLSAKGLGGYSGDGGLETKISLLKLEGGYPFLV
ncbi:methylated-DNA--[protein]-cysteine S-methyltransferase [Roseibium sp.]|uniref:methylated-DNA--[protein]-cysteine S-methyltransferase n=1 Tax=Roseibium sp. TaxID=1936156 RepID=UPI003A977FD7